LTDDREVGPGLVRRVMDPFQRFVHDEAAGGRVLLLATAAALVWANGPAAAGYEGLWHFRLGVIAVAYTDALELEWLLAAAGGLVVVAVMRWAGVGSVVAYVPVGVSSGTRRCTRGRTPRSRASCSV
jgi:Na+/H+ antiporter NhaA